MSLFSTLGTATGGLQAQSYAVQTTSHNIANANTDGYSRQRVNLEALPADTFSGIGQVGTGVDIVDVRRIRDEFLDAQIRSEQAIKGTSVASQEVLQQLEIIFLEPSDTGVNQYLSDFWDSWEELVNYPEAKTSRTAVAETSQTLAQELNDMARQIDNLKEDTITSMSTDAYTANKILEEVQDISDQIYRMTNRGLYPNDLYDKRDIFLDQLSSLMDVDVRYDAGERIEITDKETGVLLLDFPTRSSIPIDISVIKNVENSIDGTQTIVLNRGGDVTDPVTLVIKGSNFKEGDVVYIANGEWNKYDKDGTVPQLLKSGQVKGELAGAMEVLEKMDNYKDELDTFAQTLAETVNFIQRDGKSGLDLFTTSDGERYINASNIMVNEAILKDSTLINPGKTTASGDGSRALAINNLRYLSLDMGVKNPIGRASIEILNESSTEGKVDISDVTVYKSSVAEVLPNGTLTLTGASNEGESFEINGFTFNFTATVTDSDPADNNIDVVLGADQALSADALVNAFNVAKASGNEKLQNITISHDGAGEITFANSAVDETITMSTTLASGTLSGATLDGGVTAVEGEYSFKILVNPAHGDSVEIDGISFEFTTDKNDPGIINKTHVLIGEDTEETAKNLAATMSLNSTISQRFGELEASASTIILRELEGQATGVDLPNPVETLSLESLGEYKLTLETPLADGETIVIGGNEYTYKQDGTGDITGVTADEQALSLVTLLQADPRFDPVNTSATGNVIIINEVAGSATGIDIEKVEIRAYGEDYSLSEYLENNYDPDTMTFKSCEAGNTIGDFYNDIVVKIGIDTEQANQGVKNQTTLLLQLEERKESISGVSIDEEAINLVKFQNAYQANARVISTLAEMLDTLLSMRM